jgi:predicted alpha/beta superfamily hydrolase
MGKMPRFFFLTGLIFLMAEAVFSQSEDTIPVTRQQEVLLFSKIMNAKRMIWIHTPAGYDQSSDTYPVLYLLDGSIHFKYVSEMVEFLSNTERNRIPEMIVVAILSDDRASDFTPIADSGISSSGGGEHFLHFIQDELMPFVNTHYRTQPYRILAAHSLGGLFALYAKEYAPVLFQSEILISPAFYGLNMKIYSGFPDFLKTHPQLSGDMYITIGNEPGSKGRIDTLEDYLKNFSPTGFRWSGKAYPEEDHFSLPYKSIYDGLKFIYADWFMNVWDNQNLLTNKVIEDRFGKISAHFGYAITPSEDFINACGYRQLNAKHFDQAIELFRQNIKNHPASFNVYDSMGEAYMDIGNKKLAIENYEKSVAINPHNEGGKHMLEKLKAQ